MYLRFLTIVLSVLVLFSGCLGGLSRAIKDNPNAMYLEGFLSAQSDNRSSKGSHILTSEDGKVTPVRSLSLNLSDTQYDSRMVRAKGVMHDKDQVFEIMEITLLDAMAAVAPSGERVIYKNTDLGIQTVYYDDWTVVEKEDAVTFTAPADERGRHDTVRIEHFVYGASSGGEKTPLSAFLDENYPEYLAMGSFIKLGVDGIDAFSVQDSRSKHMDYFIFRHGYVYHISFIPFSDNASKNAAVFLTMMAEFQFTAFTIHSESDEESGGDSSLPVVRFGFSSFESLPYHFRAQYPAQWYYSGAAGKTSGVLHHYSFSDAPLSESGELLSLDIMKTPPPAGTSRTIEGKSLTEVSIGTFTEIYTVVGGLTYKFRGDSSFRDILLIMAHSVTSLES